MLCWKPILKALKTPLNPPNFLLIIFTKPRAFAANRRAAARARAANHSAFLRTAAAIRRACARARAANHRALLRAAAASRRASARARLNFRLAHLFSFFQKRRFLSWGKSPGSFAVLRVVAKFLAMVLSRIVNWTYFSGSGGHWSARKPE